MSSRKIVDEGRAAQAPGDFLYYWLPKEVDEHLEAGLSLDSAVGAQFKRVPVGSRLWIVTCREGRLHLAGPIQVARLLTPRVAKKTFDWAIPAGRLCAIPARGKAVACRNVDISDVAGDLRFQSESAPRLTVVRGRVNPQQLQTIRLLAPDAARLLERRWSGAGSSSKAPNALDRSDAGAARRVVEGLLGSQRARKVFYAVLSRAIRAAHGTSGDCWSVTLFDEAVRLNVGQIEVVHLTKDGLRLIVDSKALSSTARRKLGSFVKDRPGLYPSVPVKKATCELPEERLAELAPVCADALVALIGEAGRRKTRSPFRGSFSEGVVRLVEKELNERLPRPVTECQDAESGVQVHITIASGTDQETLERAAQRKTAVRWTLPLKAKKGDLVLFHLAGSGLVAKGRVTAPPRTEGKGRQAFGNKHLGRVGLIELFSRTIRIDFLRDAMPEFGWLRYPRSLTTVPPAVCPRLLALVESGEPSEADASENETSEAESKPGGQGFGIPEQNRAVERAAIELVMKRYQSDGWHVVSRESDRVGYDLECARGRERLHLEVKGLSGEEWGFFATVGELRRAEIDPHFRLIAVGRAGSPEAKFRIWKGSDLCSAFSREPIAFRLRLKGR